MNNNLFLLLENDFNTYEELINYKFYLDDLEIENKIRERIFNNILWTEELIYANSISRHEIGEEF
jgi:hypothetical protein